MNFRLTISIIAIILDFDVSSMKEIRKCTLCFIKELAGLIFQSFWPKYPLLEILST